MTGNGFLQVLPALSLFKYVSGPTGSTFGAFEGLFEEVAGCEETVCDVMTNLLLLEPWRCIKNGNMANLGTAHEAMNTITHIIFENC